ncbi:LysM domain-containing protein [Anaerobacillus alkaliphilus]|uniref:LysM domain-containing protein n=1 Tax=Anaerobacillus alkaliphilus TaxID=1548597 RepID=A0A4Q0VV85_9BACI|nr:LysM domain-containing protein [Anaerobacillus alkaliphilus]RXJ02393.1 LysM domain-containing protein [Anaerobacillus alkaliphilus]
MRIHITKRGETLYDVADRYKMDVNVLFGHNQHVDPHNLQEGMQLTIPSLVGLPGVMDDKLDGKGNVCAYVSDEPVKYNKLNVQHWPSQDYTKPFFGTHHNEMDFTNPVYYPQHTTYHAPTPVPHRYQQHQEQQQYQYQPQQQQQYYQYPQPPNWNY